MWVFGMIVFFLKAWKYYSDLSDCICECVSVFFLNFFICISNERVYCPCSHWLRQRFLFSNFSLRQTHYLNFFFFWLWICVILESLFPTSTNLPKTDFFGFLDLDLLSIFPLVIVYFGNVFQKYVIQFNFKLKLFFY